MKDLFFDLDGTLVDSSEGIISCFTKTFTDLGLHPPDLSTLKTFIGPPLETSFSQFGDRSFIEKASTIYRQHYHDKGVNQVKLYEGIIPSLRDLKDKGYRLYIATSKNEELAIKMLTNLSIIPLFDGVYGAKKDSYTKSDILKRALIDKEIVSFQALMIGDTSFDMIGAKNLDMNALGVLWGFGQEDELVASGADKTISKPKDILKAVESW